MPDTSQPQYDDALAELTSESERLHARISSICDEMGERGRTDDLVAEIASLENEIAAVERRISALVDV